METKAFSTPVLASITSGVLLEAPFSKVHEAAEFVMGNPVWTHELASGALWQLMRAKLLEQHPGLDVEASTITEDNYQEVADRLKAELGDTLEVLRGDETRGADPVTTAHNVLGPDKSIIPIRRESE